MTSRDVNTTLAVLRRSGKGWDEKGEAGYIQCNSWRVSKFGEIAMRVAAAREGRHISGPAPTSPHPYARDQHETETTKRENERGTYARAREEIPAWP